MADDVRHEMSRSGRLKLMMDAVPLFDSSGLTSRSCPVSVCVCVCVCKQMRGDDFMFAGSCFGAVVSFG